MNNQHMEDKIRKLEELSGLRVKTYKEKNQNVFQFFWDLTAVYTTFTYKKAKAFALGVYMCNKMRGSLRTSMED